MIIPLISVITPVYNAEKYLQRCIDSLLSQTYSNIEFIFVDDCSTDKSLEILKNNAQRDDRVRIVRQKINGGASKSRNVGLLLAKGEFIGFVDSDDFVEPTMYENLLKAIQTNANKLSCCGIYRYDESSGKTCKILTPQSPTVFSASEALKSVFLQKDIGYSVYSKLFHRSLWEGISFPTDGSFEDIAVLPEIFLKSMTVSHTGTAEYYYVSREESVTSSKVDEKNLVIYPRIDEIEKVVRGKFYDIYGSFQYMKIINYSNLYIKAITDSVPKYSNLYKTIRNHYNNIYKYIPKNRYLTLRDKLRLSLLRLGLYPNRRRNEK
ncbi:glycosyltransferase family 2 protein [Streptococcus suis]|nr:glycosyltransferase family 2 protein [Streptococcus suis]